MKNLHFFLAFLLALALWSCEDCGVTTEPRLMVRLSTSKQPLFHLDTVFALQTDKAVFRRSGTVPLTSIEQFDVPLNLNADSTQYVFVVNGQRGLLTVRYRREFAYRSERCGYVLELRDPKKLQNASSSLGKTENITYQTNSFSSGFLYDKRLTGIFLTIQL